MNLQKLFKKNAQGKIETWSIQVIDNGITTTYGEHNGKQQIVRERIQFGKNIGRANETTPNTQAKAEAQARWTKKIKAGYIPSLISAQRGEVDTRVIKGGFVPMLAEKYKDFKDEIVFPVMCQFKLNGHRCEVTKRNGVIALWTRTRKPILSCPHIIEDLEFILADYDNIELDGELYNNEENQKDIAKAFEKLSKIVRKQSPSPESLSVSLHLFDKVDDMPFEVRTNDLAQLQLDYTSVEYVKPWFAKNDEEIQHAFKLAIKNKYEGLIIRDPMSGYEHKRTKALLKYKVMDDDEFAILGFTQGKSDSVVAICKNNINAEIFYPTMKGEKASNQKYLKHPKKYIGKMLTVQYQGLTGKNKVPLFPVGVSIREEK